MPTPAPGAILRVICAADPPEAGQKGAQQEPNPTAAVWSLCWLVRAEAHAPSRSPARFHHTRGTARFPIPPPLPAEAETGWLKGNWAQSGFGENLTKHDALGFPGDWHLYASLVLPLPQIPSMAACARKEAPPASVSHAASQCLQKHQSGTSSTSVPLCQGTVFALGRDFLLARVSMGPAPCSRVAIVEALAARCARSQQVLKANVYLEAEMGTSGPPENTSSCRCWDKARTPAGFPCSPGLSLGLQSSHVLQTLSCRAWPHHGASCPLPQPTSSQLAVGEKMLPQGGSVPSTSCPAPCQLVNSRRHGCSPLWEWAETLLNHWVGIYILTAAPGPGPCCCAQT